MTTMIMKSHIFCCSRNHAAIHDVYYSQPPTQVKKPLKPPLEKELPAKPAPAFRSIPSLTSEDCDDILSLKRANPVCDSDEEDFRFLFKHQWIEERDDEEESSEVTLYWSSRVPEAKSKGFYSLYYNM
jgi:hypothetical protein